MSWRKKLTTAVHVVLPMTNPKTNLSLQAAKAAIPAVQRIQQQNPTALLALAGAAGANASPMATSGLAAPMHAPQFSMTPQQQQAAVPYHRPTSILDFFAPRLAPQQQQAANRSWLYGG